MNVTLTSLEALILKATHESLPCPDGASLEAFCVVMKDSSEGAQLAAQALAARIHSTNMREVMLALSMVDRCMRRGDASFHAEIGKFRFLNEMIKLVSPKYLADRTAPEVRTRVLQLLHAWSLEYPKESKFKVAFDMLKNQGVVKETPPPLPPEEGGPASRSRAKSIIFDDEEKSKLLQKLLQSKKPEDIQHANRLIKTMVREEERRSEEYSQRLADVTAALDSAQLLNDMIGCAHRSPPSADERQLMAELNNMCARMRPPLQGLAAAAAPDHNPESIQGLLQTIDLLYAVQLRYKIFLSTSEKDEANPSSQPSSHTLLDFAGACLARVGETSSDPDAVGPLDIIEELGDIFLADTESLDDNVALAAEPLKPVSLMHNDDVDLLGDKPKAEGWNELDSLGEQLLKQSLPENARRGDGFNGKAKKIPMNALTSPKHEPSASNGAMLDLDFFTKQDQPKPGATLAHDDVMVDITEPCGQSDGLIVDLGSTNSRKEETGEGDRNVQSKLNEVKSLADINVTLDSVTPSAVPPMTVFEEEAGLTVVLHFCKDKPRPDVNVIVVSTTSKNKAPITDYKFQTVVPKGCKSRLLAASGSSLPGYNPFLPPPALTQLLLVGRPPAARRPGLKFVLTYSAHDDCCSEIGDVGELPLDDV